MDTISHRLRSSAAEKLGGKLKIGKATSLGTVAVAAALIAAVGVSGPAFAGQSVYTSKSCGARAVTVSATAQINTTHMYRGYSAAGLAYTWNADFPGGGTHSSYSGMASGEWSVLFSTSYSGGSATCYSI